MALDESRALDGEPYLQATAREAEARMSPRTAADAGITNVAVISNDRGSITLPAVLDSRWSTGSSGCRAVRRGLGVPQHLAASAGDLVTIGPADELAVADDDTEASQ